MTPVAIITLLVGLLGKSIPAVAANSGLISEVVQTLVALMPTLVKEYRDLLPEVKNIIAALRSGPLTDDQQAALAALEQQADAAFEAAAKAKGLGPAQTAG